MAKPSKKVDLGGSTNIEHFIEDQIANVPANGHNVDIDIDVRGCDQASDNIDENQVHGEFLARAISMLDKNNGVASVTFEDMRVVETPLKFNLPSQHSFSFYECHFDQPVNPDPPASGSVSDMVFSRCVFTRNFVCPKGNFNNLDFENSSFLRDCVLQNYDIPSRLAFHKLSFHQCSWDGSLYLVGYKADGLSFVNDQLKNELLLQDGIDPSLEAKQLKIDGCLVVDGISLSRLRSSRGKIIDSMPAPSSREGSPKLIVSDVTVGLATYINVQSLSDETYLSNLNLGELDLNLHQLRTLNPAWYQNSPKVPPVQLDSLAFRRYREMDWHNGDNSNDDQVEWGYLSPILTYCAYNPFVYNTLRTYYVMIGQQRVADEVFSDMKTAELHNEPFSMASVLNYIFYLLSDYGKRTWLAIIYCAVFFIFGLVVFGPSHMRNAKTGGSATQAGSGYNRVLYSLSLLVPFVELYPHDEWEPDEERKFARIYLPFHIVFGWMLVPLAIATVSGFFSH